MIDLKIPQVGELTFSQWQDWLARYNAVLAERDNRIKKLEAALKKIALDDPDCCMIADRMRETAEIALEGKDD